MNAADLFRFDEELKRSTEESVAECLESAVVRWCRVTAGRSAEEVDRAFALVGELGGNRASLASLLFEGVPPSSLATLLDRTDDVRRVLSSESVRKLTVVDLLRFRDLDATLDLMLAQSDRLSTTDPPWTAQVHQASELTDAHREKNRGLEIDTPRGRVRFEDLSREEITQGLTVADVMALGNGLYDQWQIDAKLRAIGLA